MDALSPHDPCEEVVLKWSSQTGKTEVCNNFCGYIIDQDPGPLLVIQPSAKPMAETWSKDRLAPMLRDTPALKGKVSDAKSRDGDNTILHKKFPGGHLTVGGANSPSGLASRPIRYLILDEVDRYEITKEGDPVPLARKRTITFWNRKVLQVSSPSLPDTKIDAAYKRCSQQFERQLPCLHCGEYQFPRLEHLVWPDGLSPEESADAVTYVCRHCGGVHEAKDQHRMKAAARWIQVKDGPTRSKGFWMNQLASTLTTWQATVLEWFEAQGDAGKLRAFVNTALAEIWEERGDKKVDADTLKARREPYTVDSLPAGVLALTAGVDVQDNRLEMEIVGWGIGEESWGADYIILHGDPAKPDVWDRLDETLRQDYVTEDGRLLRIRATAVDSGGHHTQEAYEFCTRRAGRNVWAIKGREGRHPVWPRRASKSRKFTGHLVRLIGVDAAKDTAYSRWALARPESGDPAPGYCHLPDSYTDEWCNQAISEKRIAKRNTKGVMVRTWTIPQGKRNEASDCRVYAYAALVGAQTERVFTLKTLAAMAARPGQAHQPTAPADPRPAPPPRPARPPRRQVSRLRMRTT